MKIKQVEELVGITRKNIRFYEDEGLLQVERAENGYREYGQTDIERLQQIKLLRKLSVPIEDIRKLFSGTLTLSDCLLQNRERLKKKKQDLEQLDDFCSYLLSEQTTLTSLQANVCLEHIDRMEREGACFMDIHRTDIHRKKTTQATTGLLLTIIVMLLLEIVILWGNSVDPLPIGILLVFMAIPLLVVGGAIAAYVGRIKEIKGGEEDEASNY